MRAIWRPALDGLTPYQTGKSLEALAEELGLPELIRLSANENPLGPSPRVVAAIAREASRVHLYPDGGSTALREALGRRLGVSPEQIIVGNGADELLSILGIAALEAGDEVVLPHPSFEPYTTVALLGGARPISSPLAGYDTDLDDMRRRITPRTKMVFVCSPHNPGRHHRAAGGPERVPRIPRRRSAPRRAGRGVPGLLRRSRLSGRRGPARALSAAGRPAHVLEDRRAGRSARGLRGGQCREHRPPQPRARAVQRQPARPGGRPHRARGRGSLEQEPAGGHRGARLPRRGSWRAAASPFPRRRPTSCS